MTTDKFKGFLKASVDAKLEKWSVLLPHEVDYTLSLNLVNSKHRDRFLACQPELQGGFASHIPTSPEQQRGASPHTPLPAVFSCRVPSVCPVPPGSSEPSWGTRRCCCDPTGLCSGWPQAVECLKVAFGEQQENTAGGLKLSRAIREAAAKHVELTQQIQENLEIFNLPPPKSCSLSVALLIRIFIEAPFSWVVS